MTGEVALKQFWCGVQDDPRIGPSHVSLYLALWFTWSCGEGGGVIVKRHLVMAAAKINGLATYHKCIRELHAWGYIHYAPSHSEAEGTWVKLGFTKDVGGKG